MSESAYEDLIRRLRGEYRVPITDGLGSAGGEEPNNPNEFVRTFEVPPINKEAAGAIENLVRAVNCHDELVETLKRAIHMCGNDGTEEEEAWQKQAEAALAKATGEVGS